MKKEITICDSCGCEIKKGHFKESFVNFHLNEWSGGSVGGSEDNFDVKADLCEVCAHKLRDFLIRKMDLKRM